MSARPNAGARAPTSSWIIEILKPHASPSAVIAAVRSGQADIGFVAYEATRLGTVEFSQTYMLVQQSFLVLGD